MAIESVIRKRYMRKLALCLLIILALCLVCYAYHSSGKAKFEPVVTLSLLAVISFILLSSFGLIKYFFDKSFSGRITVLKPEIRYYKESAFERKITTRTYLGMTVECDNGRTVFFEEILLPHFTTKIPFKEGDRVYHIKGAKHLCRFPRNDTEMKYKPVSVICPVCGALHPLGTLTCNYCENELPYDPLEK